MHTPFFFFCWWVCFYLWLVLVEFVDRLVVKIVVAWWVLGRRGWWRKHGSRRQRWWYRSKRTIKIDGPCDDDESRGWQLMGLYHCAKLVKLILVQLVLGANAFPNYTWLIFGSRAFFYYPNSAFCSINFGVDDLSNFAQLIIGAKRTSPIGNLFTIRSTDIQCRNNNSFIDICRLDSNSNPLNFFFFFFYTIIIPFTWGKSIMNLIFVCVANSGNRESTDCLSNAC